MLASEVVKNILAFSGKCTLKYTSQSIIWLSSIFNSENKAFYNIEIVSLNNKIFD